MVPLLDLFIRHYRDIDSESSLRCKYCDSWNGINRSDEVAAIRSYITGTGIGLNYLNAHVAPVVSSSLFDVKFAGVFCHKKPVVRRTDAAKRVNPSHPEGCELGDLLVAFLLLDSDDQLHYYASSLFQAKVKDKLDNQTQQYLYEADASFILPKNLGGAVRDLPKSPAERSRAFRYLLMGQRRSNHGIDARRSPWAPRHSVSWGNFVHDLMQGNEGLEATPRSGGSEWDLINNDLLIMASKVPAHKPGRGSNVATQLATGTFNSFASRDIWHEWSEHEGVPTILMIVAAREPFQFSTQT